MSDTPVSEPTPGGDSSRPAPTARPSSAPETPAAPPRPNSPTPIPSTPTGAGSGAEGSSRSDGAPGASGPTSEGSGESAANRNRRRRGSRGGRNRTRPAGERSDASAEGGGERPTAPRPTSPDRPDGQGTPRPPAGPRPQIGDSRPAPVAPTAGGSGPAPSGGAAGGAGGGTGGDRSGSRRRRGGRGRGQGQGQGQGQTSGQGGGQQGARSRQPQRGATARPVEAILGGGGPELDAETLERRRGRERNGRPVGRYLMIVSVRSEATQIAVLEGRTLIEHFVSRPADDDAQIHGNIYLGKVQNVLPGMEAAFVDISTPKNAVLYRGDVQFDADEIEGGGAARIEQILRAKQPILCQVTKNPIAHKGARLTQEVSLPGRFVVLIPNSTTYGISKRLADDERRRLRSILDKVKPPQHGVIVRTAAEGITAEEISADVRRLLSQWEQIEQRAASVQAPALLYREPDMALRVIREEFNDDYRGVVIDDPDLYREVRDYVSSISPALADRVQYYDRSIEPLSIFERHHVHEQLHKALDRKVWLPSGGSLIIEHTEALTVIDVNTGKNVGSSNLEETVYRNNLEAAVEIAKQLRLRDVGGIIVIDFIDMEIKKNRDEVVRVFRDALARDKTRTQVFEISELGLVEMTRKRIGEGLLESFASACPECEGRGVRIDDSLLG
ncbi:MAG: Rne/Rng family ribonuclease [Acidobacteria bacterium]|nr:Rne/Rng family ribonuclease [Acidobacteriota bacterium]